MIAFRWRKEERAKDLQGSQKNNKAGKPCLVCCGSVEKRCTTEQNRHLQHKRSRTMVPQTKSHLAHTVIKREVRGVNNQVKNPVRKYRASDDEPSPRAAQRRKQLAYY